MKTTMVEIFEKNIAQLIHLQPVLAAKLFTMASNTHFEIFQGKDPIDINFLDTKTNEFVFVSPVKDIETYLEEHKTREKIPYRYFFGIGNGVIVKLLLGLKHVDRVMIIEPNIELLYIALHLFDFSQDIKDKRLVLELSEDLNYAAISMYLMNIGSKTYSRLFEMEVLTDYYLRIYSEEAFRINKLMTSTIESTIISHGNDMIDSLMGIEHHIVNLPEMIRSIPLKSLTDYKSSKTAIIVSTGPSLSKQIPLLKKIQDYVTIICVDASFPILEKNGIKPDFVTILERVPETAKFFESNERDFQKDVNFVMVSFVHEKVKNAITYGNIVMVMRPNEYLRHFKLDQYGYLGHGMSAANLAHDLAIALNIPNIILIGQDLAFGEDNTSHAEGHVYGENEEDINGHEIYIEKYGGTGEIRTTKYWVLFKNGFERSIACYKEQSTTINSTEGGARIEGTIELSFADAIEKYVDTTFVKEKNALKYATKQEISKYTKRYIDVLNTWIQDSVKKQELVEKVFMKVQKSAEKLNKMVQNNTLDKLTLEYLASMLDEIDKVKVLFDDEQFAKLYTIVLQSSILSLELSLAPITLEKIETDFDKKIKMVKWILSHRYWLFIVAGGIEATRVTILRAIETWPEDLQKKIKKFHKKEVKIDQKKYEELMKKVKEEEIKETLNLLKIAAKEK